MILQHIKSATFNATNTNLNSMIQGNFPTEHPSYIAINLMYTLTG